MTRQRSSIRGKGAEILFGASPAVDVEPRHSRRAFSTGEPLAPVSPRPQAAPLYGGAEQYGVLDKDRPSLDWLAEEVNSGDGELVLTPEMESALLEEALAGAEPSGSSGFGTLAGQVVTVDEPLGSGQINGLTEAVLQEPPAPESSDVTNGVLPPRPARMLRTGRDLDQAAADIQAPGEAVDPLILPERDLPKTEAEELLALYGAERIEEMIEEIEDVYAQVLDQVGESEKISTDCFNLLLRARDIVVRRDVTGFPQAEYYIEQARARLKRAAESQASARKYAWLITLWGFLWGGVFVWLLIFLSLGWLESWLGSAGKLPTAVAPEIFLPAMVWGGLGGVVAIWYSLFKHVSLRDFDPQYNLSYIGKPFFGLILGGTVYMIVQLLILTLGISTYGLAEGLEELSSPIIAPWLVYLLAWVCGFNENRIFGLVDRVVKQVFSGGEGSISA